MNNKLTDKESVILRLHNLDFDNAQIAAHMQMGISEIENVLKEIKLKTAKVGDIVNEGIISQRYNLPSSKEKYLDKLNVGWDNLDIKEKETNFFPSYEEYKEDFQKDYVDKNLKNLKQAQEEAIDKEVSELMKTTEGRVKLVEKMFSKTETPKGYHKMVIPKGELGEFSKIEEEFYEFKDAKEQNNPIMELIELSDMLGAIEAYVSKYNMDLEKLITMTRATQNAFKNGGRK